VPPLKITDFEFVSSKLLPRKSDSNKGDFGRALIVAGSYGMCGAAILAAKGCLRSGVGTLRVALPDNIYPIAASTVPESMFIPLKPSASGGIDSSALKVVSGLAAQSAAVLVGCGMQNTEDTRAIVSGLLDVQGIPLIIDADGINSVSDDIDLLRNSPAQVVLTPHPGEMSRLTKTSIADIQSNRREIAARFAAETGAVVLLKGKNTVIASPNGEAHINPTGNPGMATGGSGDLLAGILLSLICQGLSLFDASVCAAYIHGAAGDAASARLSQHSMLPSDMIDELPGVFLNIETGRR